MKSKPPTPSHAAIEEIANQVKPGTPPAIIESLAAQLSLAREARGRIVKEGSVVRDPKGSVVAHPAIKIEADALKLLAPLLKEWKRRHM